MNAATIKDLLMASGFVLMQILLFRHLQFFGTEPDIVLAFLLWLAATRDRTTVLLYAAGTGLAMDMLLDLWGINLMAKILTIFLGYHFIPKMDETRLLANHVFLILIAGAFFHNLIFLGLAHFAQIYSIEPIFWRVLLGNSLFTAMAGSFIYLFKSN